MKEVQYIRCPRCELNYIVKKDKFCNICKAEMKAKGSAEAVDELDLEFCPVCKTNYINVGENICIDCAKERMLSEGQEFDESTVWDDAFNEEGDYSEEEEHGEMASITDLDDTVLDDEDDLGLPFADDELEDPEIDEEVFEDTEEKDGLDDEDDDDIFDEDDDDDFDDEDDMDDEDDDK